MSDWGSCRSCGAGVRWAKSATTDKAMPLDRDAERGNVVIDSSGKAHAFRNHAAAIEATQRIDSMLGGETWLAHHVTCPAGSAWRGKKRSDADSPQASLLP